MSAPDKLPNGVKSLIRFSPNQTSIFMRGRISITSLVSSEAARTIAESVKRQQGSSLILHVLLVMNWVYQKWDFQAIFVKNLTNMKKSFVQLEFKPISSLSSFQNPRHGFQVPHLTLVSIIYCSNFQLCCKLLTTAYVLKLFRFEKKKSYCFCLFFIWCYFIFSLINTLVHVKIDHSIHQWKNQLLTYAISKKYTIFGFSNHAAKASVLSLFSLQTFLLYNVLVSKEYVYQYVYL